MVICVASLDEILHKFNYFLSGMVIMSSYSFDIVTSKLGIEMTKSWSNWWRRKYNVLWVFFFL